VSLSVILSIAAVHSARFQRQIRPALLRVPIKFQSNGSQRAIHTMFSYTRSDTPCKTMHATLYVICQLEAGLIAYERLCAFYARNSARTIDSYLLMSIARMKFVTGIIAKTRGLRLLAAALIAARGMRETRESREYVTISDFLSSRCHCYSHLIPHAESNDGFLGALAPAHSRVSRSRSKSLARTAGASGPSVATKVSASFPSEPPIHATGSSSLEGSVTTASSPPSPPSTKSK